MSVPNILTILRFILVPIFAYFLSTRHYITAAVLFLAGGLTDVLDGYIARKYNLVTSWGKIADPLADKLMQVTAMVILSFYLKIIPVELIVIMLLKEIFIGIGAIVLYKQNSHVVSANWYGKMATVFFYLAVIMLLFDNVFGFETALGLEFNRLFFIIAVLVALFAFSLYINSFFKIKRQNEGKAK
ncbi:MAG: CDP-diacylglycerol--glycerol-3-phosphate 3-phosphatidyltransferase [Peptococcales bacterium]|jgi:cardiolipin synthase